MGKQEVGVSNIRLAEKWRRGLTSVAIVSVIYIQMLPAGATRCVATGAAGPTGIGRRLPWHRRLRVLCCSYGCHAGMVGVNRRGECWRGETARRRSRRTAEHKARQNLLV